MRGGALLAELWPAACLLYELLGLPLLLLGQYAALLGGELSHSLSREVHATQALSHSCCAFRGPRTAHQRGKHTPRQA